MTDREMLKITPEESKRIVFYLARNMPDLAIKIKRVTVEPHIHEHDDESPSGYGCMSCGENLGHEIHRRCGEYQPRKEED